MSDYTYMRQAIHLAEKGRGWTSPNPVVGAVIVKNDQIIGQGYHQRYGQLHAERNALASCTESAQGATIYVTLEPCCHHGLNPPCTDAILEAGISRVVIGSQDPNEKVAGKGIAILQKAGLQVETDFMKEECDAQNAIFFHYITKKTPYIALKYAMTADGKIATHTGDSRWITGEQARTHVHQLRHAYSGIMTGIGTVLADDPQLNCRLPEGKSPIRIICDSQLRIPLSSQLVQTAHQVPVIIAAAAVQPEKERQLAQAGVQILHVPGEAGQVDFIQLMKRLGDLKIDSILVEGGTTLNGSILQSGLVQKTYVYIGAKVFGGSLAKSPIGGSGVAHVTDAVLLKNLKVTKLDPDILLEYEVSTSNRKEERNCSVPSQLHATRCTQLAKTSNLAPQLSGFCAKTAQNTSRNTTY